MFSTIRPQRLAAYSVFLLLALARVEALYFYLGAGDTKCFLEDLPQHTIVVGEYETLFSYGN